MSKFNLGVLIDYAIIIVSIYLVSEGEMLEGIFSLLLLLALNSVGKDE